MWCIDCLCIDLEMSVGIMATPSFFALCIQAIETLMVTQALCTASEKNLTPLNLILRWESFKALPRILWG